MPLKLLGKKSWHVYNADNIARVRRDEAEARAREAEEERQQRAAESAQREALLRGETFEGAGGDTDGAVVTSEQAKWRDAARAVLSKDGGPTATTMAAVTSKPSTAPLSSMRRPRKRHGEDDTDYEMRLARSQVQADAAPPPRPSAAAAATALAARVPPDAPLVDRHGHIDLFGLAEPQRLPQSRTYVDPAPDAPPSSMRLADATGGRDALSAWYAGEKGPTPASRPSLLSSSVDTNKPPRKPPLPAPAGSLGADPLMAMRKGAAAVRALNQERQRETDERAQTIKALVAEEARPRERPRARDGEKRERGRRGRRRDRDDHYDDYNDVDSLEGFSLDDVRDDDQERRRRAYRDRRDDSRETESRHRRDRDRDRDRDRRHHRGDSVHETSRHRRHHQSHHHRHHDRHSRERHDASSSHRHRHHSRDRDRSRRSDDVRDDRERRHRSSLSPRRSRLREDDK